jgi:hypothetical protein
MIDQLRAMGSGEDPDGLRAQYPGWTNADFKEAVSRYYSLSAEGKEVPPAPASAPKSEASPQSPEEQTIAELQQRIADLEARLAAPRTEGGEQPPAGASEAGPASAQEQDVVRLREENERLRERLEAKRQPGEGIEEIEELGTEKGLSFWEKWKTKSEAGNKDWKAAFSLAMAQWSKNGVEYRDAKIKEWEAKGKEAQEQGLLGSIRSVLWHEAWGNWHKFWGRQAYKGWKGWDNARRVAEDERDAILNQGAERIDSALRTFENRADEYARERDRQEAALNAMSESRKVLVKQMAGSRGERKGALQARIEEQDRRAEQIASIKSMNEQKWKEYRKRADKQTKRKQSILTYAVRPARIDTTPVLSKEYAWLPEEVRINRPTVAPARATRTAKKKKTA